TRLGPSREPFLERTLTLGRRLTGQEIRDADILVEGRPVDAAATGDEPPGTPLLGRGVHQPRVPGQRHGDGAAVGQVHGQGVLAYRYSDSQGSSTVNRGRTHANS